MFPAHVIFHSLSFKKTRAKFKHHNNSCTYLQKWIWIVENLNVGSLHSIIQCNEAESRHGEKLPVAMMTLVVAGKIGPMSPAEEHLGWRTQDFQHLPGKSLREGIAELPMTGLKGFLGMVVQRFVATR